MFGILPAKYYIDVYLLLVTLITFIVIRPYPMYGMERISDQYKENVSSTVLLAVIIILFIGLRPVSGVFMDMGGYAMAWDSYHYDGFNKDEQNFLFDNLRFFMSDAGFSYTSFFLLIALIYFGCMAWACRELFPQDTLIAFLVCLAAFSTFSYGTNGIKAGSAASIFLVAIAMKDKGKTILAIVFLIISLGFHHSMVLPIASFAVCLFVKKPRLYRYLWIACFIIALLHIKFFQNLFAGFVDDHSAGYLLGEEIRHETFGGFRIDFILYSAAPIFVGWWFESKKLVQSESYSFVLNVYTMINAMWLLCMYASYTNRIAYLSWLMYPIVLIYPFLKLEAFPDQYRMFKNVVICHLCFTLFMVFIYYA